MLLGPSSLSLLNLSHLVGVKEIVLYITTRVGCPTSPRKIISSTPHSLKMAIGLSLYFTNMRTYRL
jgi:hypothetical protein